MDQLSAIRAFISVSDAGGFAPAARELGLATSSVTRQVSALEDHLGTQLLNRSTRSVTLTDAGRYYLEDVRCLIEDLEAADRRICEGDTQARGLLRIGVPVAFARLHVSPHLPAYLQAHPEVAVELVLSDRDANFVEERLDLAVRLGALADSSLIARKLAPHRRVVCASSAYLEKRGVPRSPSELTSHDCLTFSYADRTRRWRFARGGEDEAVSVRGSLQANSSEVLLDAALAGVGLALLPTWLVGPHLSNGSLQVLLPDWQAGAANTTAAVYGLFPPNRRGSLKVGSFLDHLQETFGSPPYWESRDAQAGALPGTSSSLPTP